MIENGVSALEHSVCNLNKEFVILSQSVQSDQKDQYERVVSKLNDEWTYILSQYK